MILEKVKRELEGRHDRSAWNRGVTLYAMELVAGLQEAVAGGYFREDVLTDRKAVIAAMLNGAEDWTEYSLGGCSLIYDTDIADRLCNPTELKRTKNGERRPNKYETWLDVQARALNQAARRVRVTIRAVM